MSQRFCKILASFSVLNITKNKEYVFRKYNKQDKKESDERALINKDHGTLFLNLTFTSFRFAGTHGSDADGPEAPVCSPVRAPARRLGATGARGPSRRRHVRRHERLGHGRDGRHGWDGRNGRYRDDRQPDPLGRLDTDLDAAGDEDGERAVVKVSARPPPDKHGLRVLENAILRLSFHGEPFQVREMMGIILRSPSLDE